MHDADTDPASSTPALNRPRIKVSIADGEYWFAAQDVWESIGASSQALKKVPKEFTRSMKVEGKRRVLAVNLPGLMVMLTSLKLRFTLPTERMTCLDGFTAEGQAIETTLAYGSPHSTVLTGVAECISALAHIHQDAMLNRRVADTLGDHRLDGFAQRTQ